MTKINATINYKGLKKLVEEMSKQYTIKVGLLASQGGSDDVEGTDFDLAGLGALMEYGSQDGKIPARSFLEMPITLKSEEILKKVKQDYSVQEINYFLKQGKIDLLSRAYMLGVGAVDAIQEAFETRGFGNWQENASSTIKAKGSDMPLIDTGNLRRHIVAEVTGEEGTLNYKGND